MVNPISPNLPSPIGAPGALPRPNQGSETSGGSDFASELRQQLEQVSHMQAEADAGIQNLLTGRTDNITQVLTSARKAEVAFGLLMEIRNKLVDAYGELKQLRV
jgi:flagellar hook-basal body complex protein FliE